MLISLRTLSGKGGLISDNAISPLQMHSEEKRMSGKMQVSKTKKRELRRARIEKSTRIVRYENQASSEYFIHSMKLMILDRQQNINRHKTNSEPHNIYILEHVPSLSFMKFIAKPGKSLPASPVVILGIPSHGRHLHDDIKHILQLFTHVLFTG
jgi:hypothetical protein